MNKPTSVLHYVGNTIFFMYSFIYSLSRTCEYDTIAVLGSN